MNSIFLLFGATLLLTCNAQDEIQQNSAQRENEVIINADGSGQWIVEECGSCGTVQWQPLSQALKVMLMGTGTGYISVALSDDKLMGPSDETYVCMTTGGQQFSIHAATLTGYAIPQFGENITSKEGSSMSNVNGMLSCNFTIDISTAVQNQGKQYYLLYAQGPVNETVVQYHFSNRSSTAEKVCLTGNCQVTTALSPTTVTTTTLSTTSGAQIPCFNLFLFISSVIVIFCVSIIKNQP